MAEVSHALQDGEISDDDMKKSSTCAANLTCLKRKCAPLLKLCTRIAEARVMLVLTEKIVANEQQTEFWSGSGGEYWVVNQQQMDTMLEPLGAQALARLI